MLETVPSEQYFWIPEVTDPSAITRAKIRETMSFTSSVISTGT